MRTPARIAKHPIHPMLVPLPIGLWIFSLVCDLARAFGASSANWEIVAWYTMIGGIVGALLAAIPGLVDLLSLPSAIKPTGVKHMALNLTIVVLYLINVWLRRDGVTSAAIWLSVLSIALLAVSGWLGGKMVYEAGVAVEPAPLGSERYRGPERRRSASAAAYFGPERRIAI
ncbi:MAG TPA: DUF2231 domain-containing protein [Burkholderiales bacterium]|nr:DUF2231 domain-containing protein [Burkholderiales bacterium]